jgi:phospholipid-binding lipoprotein MlaA
MKQMNLLIRLPLILAVLFTFTACTTLKVSDDPTLQNSSDPLVGLNRSIFKFNLVADEAVLRPVAKTYAAMVPDPAQNAVGRFFSNLGEPINVVNNLLQGKVDGALNSTYRFAVNSTIGILGLFDVAKTYQVDRKSEDFGQTLAAWGVKPGPYLVLPFLGPSNFRDGLGFAVDNITFDGRAEITDSNASRASLTAVNVVEIRANFLGSADLLDQQLDPYLFLKEAYQQSRLNSIYDGNPPEQSDDDLDF